MKHQLRQNNTVLRPICLLNILLLVPLFIWVFALSGCQKSVDYFSYVSEFRNNIFLAETDGLCLYIHSVLKETPYAADGVANESTARTEVFLSAPEGTQNYTLYIEVDGKQYGGELAFDNVKAEYFLSFSLDISELKELPCVLQCGESKWQFVASSVLRNETVTPRNILDNVRAYAPEIFENLTDKYGFKGEIYLRLLYEDAPYYYVGVIDRNGDIYAFLVNATNGKVLARRNP
ncbi:MAG: hypothetical protein IJ308_00935 [Clostridia bacterium]|nr:hypothetical protein [Clostridia bacterium]